MEYAFVESSQHKSAMSGGNNAWWNSITHNSVEKSPPIREFSKLPVSATE